MMVAALFVRKDSIYKSIPGVDAWDKDRDARNWPGGEPIVAHPPCAQWGRFAQWAHVKPAEKALALLALDLADRWGGVVEHPATSRLWTHVVGRKGWLWTIDQRWWGHRAIKRTTLYISGIKPVDMPPTPYDLGEPTNTVENMGKAERERTPPFLARWLVDLASRCSQDECPKCGCPRGGFRYCFCSQLAKVR